MSETNSSRILLGVFKFYFLRFVTHQQSDKLARQVFQN